MDCVTRLFLFALAQALLNCSDDLISDVWEHLMPLLLFSSVSSPFFLYRSIFYCTYKRNPGLFGKQI